MKKFLIAAVDLPWEDIVVGIAVAVVFFVGFKYGI